MAVQQDTAHCRRELEMKFAGGRLADDQHELSFTGARVPVANTIGEIGRGFQQQMTQFQNERMIAAYTAVGAMDRALALTAAYLRDRQTFGRPLLSRQYVQFRLAELAAEVDTLRHYNYACAEAYIRAVFSRFSSPGPYSARTAVRSLVSRDMTSPVGWRR